MAWNESTDKYAGRNSAWHNNGLVAGMLLTYDQAVGATDLARTFRKEQRTNPYTGQDIRSWDVFRDDDKWIATVGERQTLLQTNEAFGPTNAMLTDVLGEEAIYESAGTLDHGAKRWLLASVGDFNVLGVDRVKNYLAVMDAVDGTMPFSLRPTSIRIVCQNTFTEASKAVATYVRKHSRNADVDIQAKMNEIRALLQMTESRQEDYNDLATRAIQATEARNIIRQLFGIAPDKQWDDIKTVTKNRIDNVFELFENNDDDQFPQFRGTAWNLFNSVTEYADHEIDVRVSSAKSSSGYADAEAVRSYNAILGTGAVLKQTALDIILEQTANAPRINGMKSFSFSHQPANLLDEILSANS